MKVQKCIDERWQTANEDGKKYGRENKSSVLRAGDILLKVT